MLNLEFTKDCLQNFHLRKVMAIILSKKPKNNVLYLVKLLIQKTNI